MATGEFVAYYRVSTQRQGRSGLGLDAQREAVQTYLNGGSWRLVAEVVEVESGKRSDRPQLAEALRLCRRHRATLVIAKLDRLARNVAFVSSLMKSGIEFTAVDFPQANRLTVHILAAVAEHEAAMISARTRAGLSQTRWGGRLPRVDHTARMAPPFSEAAHDPVCHRRQAEAARQGRLQGSALRGSADRTGRLLVPALSAELP
ncbi:recombinase family protein [Methylorubrum extorquens]